VLVNQNPAVVPAPERVAELVLEHLAALVRHAEHGRLAHGDMICRHGLDLDRLVVLDPDALEAASDRDQGRALDAVQVCLDPANEVDRRSASCVDETSDSLVAPPTVPVRHSEAKKARICGPFP
jgi:hypothetical protein